ncbi:ParB/RepB/Spo0J family partition protein [Nitrospirillum pindoramense]|uniref:Chromosome segregation DNA-binding protein n=1 Tax=Nitrospirillum amazonense TaxID=28077 RepID=A0A560GTL7_9PROT|nr:chromosome segregation DNA-binding protein [Nitrospirillum amazonense]
MSVTGSQSMDEMKKRSNLGRGLSALFAEVADEQEPVEKGRPPRTLPIELLHPGRYQPRRHFDEEAIRSLVDSIRERGVLQPILVRKLEDGGVGGSARYEIIAGERRWRAAQLAGLHEVPVVVRSLTDREALEIALVENIQRQDLTPLEEAEGFQRLMDEFNHTQEDLARAVGKSRSHVANMLRLLALPDAVKALVQDGSLTMGHARALLTAADPLALAREVVKRGLNVRQTEQLVKDAANPAARPAPAPKTADTLALEKELAAELGLKVALKAKGQAGSLTVHYANLDQLDGLLARLKQRF